MNLLLFLVYRVCADTVLLRHTHGSGADRHRDAIECVALDGEDDDGSLFSEERLLAPLVLPSALWCDDERRCHDRTSGREYKAETLVCDETKSSEVRCTARIDCAPYIEEFWSALIATFTCVVLLILVPGICIADRRQRMLERYDKDRSV